MTWHASRQNFKGNGIQEHEKRTKTQQVTTMPPDNILRMKRPLPPFPKPIFGSAKKMEETRSERRAQRLIPRWVCPPGALLLDTFISECSHAARGACLHRRVENEVVRVGDCLLVGFWVFKGEESARRWVIRAGSSRNTTTLPRYTAVIQITAMIFSLRMAQ